VDFVFSLLIQTTLVPIVVSVIVAATVSRISRVASASGAISLAAGFFAGWAQQEWTVLQPTRYLDWLPWICVILAIVAVGFAVRIPRKILLPLTGAACLSAAWLLVPAFPRLQPPQPIAVAMIGAASILLVGPLEHSAIRINTRLLTVCLMATGTAGSIVLAQSFALKFAQIAGILTAALAGTLLLGKSAAERSSVGLQLVFVTMFANLMFIGYANSSSDVPIYSYALIVAAPLALWGAFRSDSDEKSPRQRLLAGGVGLVVILLIAVIPALLAHPPWDVE
jgi:hypothetical protein